MGGNSRLVKLASTRGQKEEFNNHVHRAWMALCTSGFPRAHRAPHAKRAASVTKSQAQKSCPKIAPGIQQVKAKCLTSEVPGEQLFPGIPNDVTLNLICPKLHWRYLNDLSSVSHGWLNTIRSHHFNNVRVHSHFTETFVLVNYRGLRVQKDRCTVIIGLALYSMRDNSCFKLPPLLRSKGGIPQFCQVVFLDGKIYVLGGLQYPSQNGIATKRVYVLDLIGPGQWKLCASMHAPRHNFGCGVLNGKIYVFGGCALGPLIEAYDVNKDTWSPVCPRTSLLFDYPLTSSQFDFSVATQGEELIVHNRSFYYSDFGQLLIPRTNMKMMEADDTSDDNVPFLDHKSLNIYHPHKDKWRVVKPFQRREEEIMFMAGGRFYSLSPHHIHVHDTHTNSWTQLHSCSFDALGLVRGITFGSSSPLAMDDELLAIAHWYDDGISTSSIVHCRGFGTERTEVVWQKVKFSIPSADWPPGITSYFMYPVKL